MGNKKLYRPQPSLFSNSVTKWPNDLKLRFTARRFTGSNFANATKLFIFKFYFKDFEILAMLICVTSKKLGTYYFLKFGEFVLKYWRFTMKNWKWYQCTVQYNYLKVLRESRWGGKLLVRRLLYDGSYGPDFTSSSTTFTRNLVNNLTYCTVYTLWF